MKVLRYHLFAAVLIHLMNQVLAMPSSTSSSESFLSSDSQSSETFATFDEDLFDWWNRQVKSFTRRNVPEGSGRGSKATRDYLLRLEHWLPMDVRKKFYKYCEQTLKDMEEDHKASGTTALFNKDRVSPRIAYLELCDIVISSYADLRFECVRLHEMEKVQTLDRNKINKPFVISTIGKKERKIYEKLPINRENERKAIFEALDELKNHEPLEYDFPEFGPNIY